MRVPGVASTSDDRGSLVLWINIHGWFFNSIGRTLNFRIELVEILYPFNVYVCVFCFYAFSLIFVRVQGCPQIGPVGEIDVSIDGLDTAASTAGCQRKTCRRPRLNGRSSCLASPQTGRCDIADIHPSCLVYVGSTRFARIHYCTTRTYFHPDIKSTTQYIGNSMLVVPVVYWIPLYKPKVGVRGSILRTRTRKKFLFYY